MWFKGEKNFDKMSVSALQMEEGHYERLHKKLSRNLDDYIVAGMLSGGGMMTVINGITLGFLGVPLTFPTFIGVIILLGGSMMAGMTAGHKIHQSRLNGAEQNAQAARDEIKHKLSQQEGTSEFRQREEKLNSIFTQGASGMPVKQRLTIKKPASTTELAWDRA